MRHFCKIEEAARYFDIRVLDDLMVAMRAITVLQMKQFYERP